MSQAHIPNAQSAEEDGFPSMSSILLAPLNDLQALSHALFLSLSPPQTKPPPAPSLSAFVECDRALASAVNLAHIHQIKQKRIESLEQDIFDLEARWRDICSELSTGNKELEELIEEGNERVKAIEAAKAAAIPYPELLAYAQSLSPFTSAPPNMPELVGPGQPPPPLFFPPFPNEEKMRRGRLNAEAPLGNLGETHTVEKVPTPPPAEPARHAPGANPYMQEFRQAVQFEDFELDLNPDL